MKKLAVALVGAVLLAAALLAAPGAAWWPRLPTWESHAGYFGPAFSHDGRFVFTVVRETAGFAWGPGWEHFTPPAYAYPMTDQIGLVRIELESGKTEILETWSSTPVSRRVIREYRGRIFNTMRAILRPDADGTVRYTVEMSIPVVPSSETHLLEGSWADLSAKRARGEWRRGGSSQAGPSEPVLAGQTELFAVKGQESFPSAVLLLDHRAMTARALLKNAAYAALYPDGPALGELLESSRKKDIERVAELNRLRGEFAAEYRARGFSESGALLKSYRELEDRGYMPKSPRITTRKLERADASDVSTLPAFDIADAEMASGIFPDIEKALAAPGAEIDKSMGEYIVHRDYENSRKLNAHLAGGGREFLIRFRQHTYRVELRYAR